MDRHRPRENRPVADRGAPRELRLAPAATGDGRADGLVRLRERALASGVNPLLYWVARIVLLPSFLVCLRLERIGSGHLPRSGPLLLAANHRSFLDPFVIGSLTRRPVYYMAKRELFERRWQAWFLNSLGAFPVDRGAGDEAAMATARAILARGDCVVIFPEGTRRRQGPLGQPRRGVGRLVLETGARVVPVAVIGTEDVRRGWRVRPRQVRVRCGAPLMFPLVEHPAPAQALGVTERIWACVNLQWEWLGGASAARRHTQGERKAPRAHASADDGSRREHALSDGEAQPEHVPGDGGAAREHAHAARAA
jgi:glycerol-3-phosphate dehydrogenase (NAD(P)+)